RVQGRVDAGGQNRNDPPREHDDRPADHDDQRREFGRGGPTGDRPDGDHAHHVQRVQAAQNHRDHLPHALAPRVAERPPSEPDVVRNPPSPWACWRPPTGSTNRSSRVPPARTSSAASAARSCPPATMATWPHMRWTTSIAWEETITVP